MCDPFAPSLGYEIPRLPADITTISHDDENHNYDRAVRGRSYVISGPGEYEINGVFVIGVPTFQDDKEGRVRGKNTSYVIEMEGVNICHLGNLGHTLSQAQLDDLGNVDVLLVPVGGKDVLSGTRAAEIVSQLEPGIVIPMHYKLPDLQTDGESVARFLREMAVDKPTPVEMLALTKTQISEDTRVVLLEPKR